MYGLKGVSSIHIVSNVLSCSPQCSHGCGQRRRRSWNVSSVSGKSSRGGSVGCGLNCARIGGEAPVSWCARIRAVKVMVADTKNRLVCEDDEEGGIDFKTTSYDQTLPPWGDMNSNRNDSKTRKTSEDHPIRKNVVVDSENVLVCKDEEEGESDLLSYEQTLPPWGNLNPNRNEFTTSKTSEDSPVHGRKSVECELAPKIYLLEERDEEILSKRMLSLSRCNKVRSALELYMSMGASGLQPNPHACNSLLASLLRNGFLNDALGVLKTMKKEMTSGHTYSLVLKAVASARGCDSALKMFEEWEREGTLVDVFDVITYNTVISICGKVNDWVLAERMWRSLKGNGHGATRVTYDLLVSAFVRSGQTELAFDAYSGMVQSGMEPGEDMMHAIISSCTKDGQWSLAYNVFQNMLKSGMNPNLVAYNALINSLGKAGEVELTFKVFGFMKSSGHKPDAYTWNALLCALNRGSRYTDALQLFECIRRNKSMQPNLHLYNTALLSCQRLGSWNRALQILWQMEASGVSVSTESFNLVISACEAARKPEVALQVYEQMVHNKCAPDTFTYLSLIRACVWGSLWSEVKEILDYVPPDVSLYNAVIHGMCLRGKISSAKEMYTKMLESGLKPDGKTRSLMIQSLRKTPIRRKNRYLSHHRRH